MNASTLSSHDFTPNWVRPDATPRSLQLRALAGRSLARDLFWALAPGLIGVAALAALMLGLR
jgi:hypothetical protein